VYREIAFNVRLSRLGIIASVTYTVIRERDEADNTEMYEALFESVC